MPVHHYRVEIDRASPEPLYQQIADIISGRIRTGHYPPGSLVPSIEQIRGEIGVTVKTITKGMHQLAAEGWVRIVPGKGTYVQPPENWPQT